MKMKKTLMLICISILGLFAFTSCGKHTHEFDEVYSYNAEAHWQVAICEHTDEKQNYGAHTYSEFIVIKEATDTENGSKKQVCSVCGYENIVLIPALGHNYSTEWSSDETNHYHECDCGDKTDVSAHEFGEFTIIKEATDTENGSKKQVCSVCGYENTVEIPALGHNYSTDWSSDETNHYHECDCGDKIDVSAHEFGEFTVIKEATHSEAGSKKQVCSVCGYENTVEIPVLDHDCGDLVEAVAPTCENDGTVAYYYCSECDKYLDENKNVIDTIVVPKRHLYDSNGICTSCGGYQPANYNETEGYYEISNAGQFNWFAKFVNAGNSSANAILVNNIDFGDSNFISVSLNESQAYNGIFDGNGYTITINQNSTTYKALFNYISSCTIKNLNVTGKIVASTKFSASIAMKKVNNDTVSTIMNCISSVTIESSVSGDGTHGGLVGVNNAGTLIITNCAFIGSIKGENTTSCGGLIGWTENMTVINNSYVTATFDNVNSCHTFTRRNTASVTINNCYYLNLLGSVDENAVMVTQAQIESGEVAYLLSKGTNGKEWGQKLGENADLYPVIKKASDESITVYKNTTYSGCEALFREDNQVNYSNVKLDSIYFEHTFGEWNAQVDATCTTNGTLGHYHCSVCDKNFDENNEELLTLVIEAFGHSCIDEWIIDTPATETSVGERSKRCSSCEDRLEITEIPMLPYSDGLVYELNSNQTGYIVTGVSFLTGTEVNITPEYKGLPVVQINRTAFQNNTTITKLIIPLSVTEIQHTSFKGCTSLESITIPFVGLNAGKTENDTYQYPFGIIFGNISYEGSVCCPQNYHGNSLSTANLGTYNAYIPSSLKEVIVLGGNILFGAFYNCKTLENVTLPESLTKIGTSAFYGCTSLVSVDLPDSITHIANSAFRGCSSLEEINLSDNVIELEGFAFYECSSLKNIHLSNSLTRIKEWTFLNCYSLTEVTLPDSINALEDSAFQSCINLEKVIFSNNLEYIGTSAFSNCKSLVLTKYEGVNYLGSKDNPYYILYSTDDNSISNVTIHPDTKIIYPNVFNKYEYLNSIKLPDGIIFIGSDSFAWCATICYVENYLYAVIPNSVKTIDSDAFYKSKINKIYYKGTSEEWANTTIDYSKNSELSGMTIYYYSEEEPTEEGNFWHYVNDVITVW